MDSLLNKLYYNPKTGFISVKKLYEKAKRINSSITLKQVRDWYAKQDDIQQHQEQRDRFDNFKIASDNPNSWQMDLTFHGQPKKPILTAININSRIGYANMLPNKKAETVLAALKEFIKHNKVEILTTDNGSEFMNHQVQQFFKTDNIEHFNNEAGDHHTMGKIERFNRTLKQRQ